MMMPIVLIAAASLLQQEPPAVPFNLTGSVYVAQGTTVGNYLGSNQPQNVTVKLTSSGGNVLYKNVILPGPGQAYDNAPICLMLAGSQPVTGNSFAGGKMFAYVYLNSNAATNTTVPISSTGVMQYSLVVGGFNAQNLELCLPPFTAAGVNFSNGITMKWQLLPTSYSLPLNFGSGPTQGQVKLLGGFDPPAKVNAQFDGTFSNNNLASMLFVGSGNGSNVNVAGLCPNSTTNMQWTGPVTNAEFDILGGP